VRIFFIVDEFSFFLPQYLDSTIERIKGKHSVVGITPLITPKEQETFYSHLIKQLRKMGTLSIVKLGIEYVKNKIESLLFLLSISNNPTSISQVAGKHGIKIFKTKNVNDQNYLSKLKQLKIDVIVSSCSQIFKKDLLNTPKIACINRHSALLPSYGGVFPVFYAMINNEKEIGVSVHKMVSQIDKGSIVSQVKISVGKNDSFFSLYKKSYEKSVDATVDAIENLLKNKNYLIKPKRKSSYFSFPDDKQWEIFFKKNLRVI
jgi:methionyl-tRNA formyltransferase